MERWKVQVKQEHIDNGKPEDIHECPINLAMRDAGYNDVKVGNSLIWTSEGTQALPEKAVRWRQDFDRGRPVKPVKFRMEFIQ